MKLQPKSIRTFIGAKQYHQSRQFYLDIGFEEYKTSEKMSYFRLGTLGFYLQDYYVKDWVENSMIFLEVDNLTLHHTYLNNLKLNEKYPNVKLTSIQYNDWGNEFFLYDPSGVLWHIGEFK